MALIRGSGAVFFRNELGESCRDFPYESVGALLAEPNRCWNQGSGDCGLERSTDGARLSFVYRSERGLVLVYEEPTSPYQLVYAPYGTSAEPAVYDIGGDQMRVPRSWYAPVEDGLAIIRQFYDGVRFDEHGPWREFLVNTF